MKYFMKSLHVTGFFVWFLVYWLLRLTKLSEAQITPMRDKTKIMGTAANRKNPNKP